MLVPWPESPNGFPVYSEETASEYKSNFSLLSRSSVSWPWPQLWPHCSFLPLSHSAPATLVPLPFLENAEQLPHLAFLLARPSAQDVFPSKLCMAYNLLSLLPLLNYPLQTEHYHSLPTYLTWFLFAVLLPDMLNTFNDLPSWLECKFHNSRDFVYFTLEPPVSTTGKQLIPNTYLLNKWLHESVNEIFKPVCNSILRGSCSPIWSDRAGLWKGTG